MFPFDPSLSKRGKRNASKVGSELASRIDARGSAVTVICSPFLRCFETALAICKVFGCSMTIDQAWGEVMAPDLFSDDAKTQSATRDIDALVALAREAGVEVKNVECFVGEAPVYPETVDTARSRYGRAFLSSLERGRSTEQSFIVVTHGEAMPVCLSFFQESLVLVGKVPYGAYLTGSMAAAEDGLPSASSLGGPGNDWVAFTKNMRLEELNFPVVAGTVSSEINNRMAKEKEVFFNSLTQVQAPKPGTSDGCVRDIVDNIVRTCLDRKAPRPASPTEVGGETPSPFSLLQGSSTEAKASEESQKKSKTPPSLALLPPLAPREIGAQFFPGGDENQRPAAGKRASPSGQAPQGLAARRRLRMVMDLGSEFGERSMTPPALIAAA
jgi:broad specificity phosphatase PhoE